MLSVQQIIEELRAYNGRQLKLMEVCGTHTASIFKNGIRSFLSDKIKLISGPGCPVCVIPTGYIDRAIELAQQKDHVLLSFGDMLKVPGQEMSLSEAKARGARVEMIYSPLEVLPRALENLRQTFIIAAVGFETTAPTYTLLLEKAIEQKLPNIKLLTALRTIIPALDSLCLSEPDIDGFIAPGHVSAIIGQEVYKPLALKYKRPFVTTGFTTEHILASIYDLMKQSQNGKHEVHNLYPAVVAEEGNKIAVQQLEKYFTADVAYWRGIGKIPQSGLYLKEEYNSFDAGSRDNALQDKTPVHCKCGSVITGRIAPNECPMFGKGCTPMKPQGPCMVSSEGTCGIWFRHGR
ncbi:hydrogenase formation protein HypD [Bacillota bacterium LX-D]|nr:hydrogenase formation protein HypD [Bacillota bacterium LX-D]